MPRLSAAAGLAWQIAAAEAEAEARLIPKSAARAIRRKGKFEVERILEIEREVKHDVIAFTTNVAEHVGREARYLHYGLTSNDVVDTAQALQIREASTLIAQDLERLGDFEPLFLRLLRHEVREQVFEVELHLLHALRCQHLNHRHGRLGDLQLDDAIAKLAVAHHAAQLVAGRGRRLIAGLARADFTDGLHPALRGARGWQQQVQDAFLCQLPRLERHLLLLFITHHLDG